MEERRAERDAEVVISDRTLIDHLAYTLTLFPESATSPEVETYKRLAFESLTSYHFIFQIPIEFLPEDDGVREPDPRFQRQIGDVLTGLYTQSGVTPVVIRGSVEERAAQVQVHLEAHNLA
jgi:predicted ATPase